VEDLITNIDAAHSIAVDMAGGKIYWPEAASGRIQRANLDGSVVEDIVVGLDTPTTLALNLIEGKMYWTDSEAFGQVNRIERANLDGSNREVIVSGIGFPWGITVTGVPEPTSAVVFAIILIFILFMPVDRISSYASILGRQKALKVQNN